ncbi:MAG: radical SAM family heme chaperone HemW [bacterium]|nr:radical SAM family heme chaperone HemW [bacterium]
MYSLYAHIPFCSSRCPYCDFAFVVQKTHLAERYIHALIQEYRTRKPTGCPTFLTIYFGGGTPSEIPAKDLGRFLEAVSETAHVPEDAEITAEANPDDQDRFAALRNLGINRLSLGVQALDDRALKALGRRHNTETAIEAVAVARRAGFSNLNLDLIFGAPEQTVCDWQATLDRAIELAPEHLSVYGLTIEPGTLFNRRLQKGRLPLPPEEDQATMYELALDRLAHAGYIQYEVSNFARPGFASRHNLAYWERQPYLGVGLSAHSFEGDRRAWNIAELMAYITEVEAHGLAQEDEEEITEENRFVEQILLGLRRNEGFPETLVAGRPTEKHLNRLLSDHLLERAGSRIRLTRRGLLLADLVCAELVKET